MIPHPSNMPFFPAQAMNGLARFRPLDKPLGVFDDVIPKRYEKFGKDVVLNPSPSVWLRLLPLEDPLQKFEIEELKKAVSSKPPLFPLGFASAKRSNIVHVKAKDGFGVYASIYDLPPLIEDPYLQNDEKKLRDNDNILTADVLAFAFTTGELWGIDALTLSARSEQGITPIVEQNLRNAMANFASFLKKLGVAYPYKWVAGFEGIEDMPLCIPVIPQNFHATRGGGHSCSVNVLSYSGIIERSSSPARILAPLFKKLYEACGASRPDWLNND